MFKGLTEICFVFRFGFRASLLDFTSRIERLHVCCYWADVWSVLAYFCSECSRARPSTGRLGQVIDSACISQFSWHAWPISFSRSTVTAAAPARLRPVCRTLCTGAWLTTDELSVVSYVPLSHSRHNAGDRSTKVGHEIIMVLSMFIVGDTDSAMDSQPLPASDDDEDDVTC